MTSCKHLANALPAASWSWVHPAVVPVAMRSSQLICSFQCSSPAPLPAEGKQVLMLSYFPATDFWRLQRWWKSVFGNGKQRVTLTSASRLNNISTRTLCHWQCGEYLKKTKERKHKIWILFRKAFLDMEGYVDLLISNMQFSMDVWPSTCTNN